MRLIEKGKRQNRLVLSAEGIEAFIRGMNPWPGAFTFLDDKRLKFFNSHILEMDSNERPGTVLRGLPGELRVATGKGCYRF